MGLKEFKVTLTHEDLVRYYAVIDVKGKDEADVRAKFEADKQKYVDKVKAWEDESIGDGYDIDIEEVEEV